MPIPIRKSIEPAPVATAATAAAQVRFGKPARAAGHRVLLYGPGGVGKTTLSTFLPGPVAFFDLDESLGRLGADAAVVEAASWADIRSALAAPGWDEVKSIVVDTATKAEEMCVAHVLANVPTDGGRAAANIESYGYGKGYGHVFDEFSKLLSDLDRHARAGRNVVLVAHDCTTSVPNPNGEDFLRYEPRLQGPASGKASIRLRVREWADHVLFLNYDLSVDKDGKATGSGSRTVYRAGESFCMAKSRTGSDPIPVSDPSAVWAEIIK